MSLVTGKKAMTLEQALAFKINGKQLRHMSEDDWRRFHQRLVNQQAMMDAFWRHQWDDEMDQRAHAQADRLADLQEALRVISRSGNLLPMFGDDPGRT